MFYVVYRIIFYLFFVVVLCCSLFFRPFSLFFGCPSGFCEFVRGGRVGGAFVFLVSLFFVIVYLVGLAVYDPSLRGHLLCRVIVCTFFATLGAAFTAPRGAVTGVKFVLGLQDDAGTVAGGVVVSARAF